MTSFLRKDIPPRAALAVVALVLFASVVTGREKPQPAPVAPSVPGPAAPGASHVAAADLDLDKLTRTRKDEAITDLFAPARVALGAVVQPEAGPPPPPSAPPLPFKYLGKIIDGDRTTLFVARGDEHYFAEAGETIAGLYKVEQVTSTAVTFIYLPLGTRQVLAVPAVN